MQVDLTSAPNPWTDKSGSGNDCPRSGTIDVVTNAQNGLNILEQYTLNNEYFTGTLRIYLTGDQTWMILYKEEASRIHRTILRVVSYLCWEQLLEIRSGSSNFNGRMRWRDGDLVPRLTQVK